MDFKERKIFEMKNCAKNALYFKGKLSIFMLYVQWFSDKFMQRTKKVKIYLTFDDIKKCHREKCIYINMNDRI